MKTKYILLSALSAIAFCACDNYLTTEYQGSTQSELQIAQAVEAIPERINSSVTGMYAKLGTPYAYFGTGQGRADDAAYPAICMSLDLNSGDMVTPLSDYDWFSVASEYSDRTPSYANPRMRSGLIYNIIYATREVIASIPTDTDNPELKAKRGQAKAIRAFAYLNLVPYYQYKYVGHETAPTVPIMADEKTPIDPLNNPRAPMNKMYEYILTDLNDAIADLKGFKRDNKGVIDRQVAFGLRARANLYMEKWAAAAADADSALVGYTPYLLSELTQPGFNDANNNGGEHSWLWAALIPSSTAGTAYASWPSQLGSFSGHGYTAGTAIYRSINNLLYDKIPATDVRKAWWLNEKTESPYLEGLTWTDDATGTVYEGQAIAKAKIADVKEPMYPYANVKFGQRSGVGSPYNDGDWCLMRAEEMILIKAEGIAKAGDRAAAKTILENFVKTYRDPNYSAVANGLDIEDEIWLQRRIELWGEGFAMADKMRLGKNIVRFRPGKDSNVPEDYRFNLSADDPWLLMRFDQTELNGNSGIVQNEGGVQPKGGNGADLKDGVTD
jgi:hypothetical protein